MLKSIFIRRKPGLPSTSDASFRRKGILAEMFPKSSDCFATLPVLCKCLLNQSSCHGLVWVSPKHPGVQSLVPKSDSRGSVFMTPVDVSEVGSWGSGEFGSGG